MRNREELRLVGSGGQGVILASVILAEAAILAGKNAAQSQSYGPEARGGACAAQAVISNGDLGFPKVRIPSFLMALTDQSVSIKDPALNAEPKLAIVLGTEGDGLAQTTIANCDYTVKIPMTHGVDSLNVAAASAVAFWQLGGLE